MRIRQRAVVSTSFNTSVAVYALALCVQLSVAVITFYTLVSAAQG